MGPAVEALAQFGRAVLVAITRPWRETRAPSQAVAPSSRAQTERAPESGPKVGFFLEFDANEFAVVSEPGAVLPPVVVSEGPFVKAAVVVVGGASEAGDGKRPGAEAKSAAEPGPDVFGWERGRDLSPEVADLWNSRVPPGAELLFACEVVCKRGPQKSQEHPPEGLTGATVVGHRRLDSPAEGMLGKRAVAAGALLGSAILVWASRAGQETGPGSNLVGKMAAGGTWSGFGSERNGPSTDPEAGSPSQAERLSGFETVKALVASERGA